MGYVKQREDLLDGDTLIPLFSNWDDAMTDQKLYKNIELNYWLPAYGQDDDGLVFTPLGIFLSIDLDYQDKIDNDDKRIVLVPNVHNLLENLDTAYQNDFSPLIRTLKPFGVRLCHGCESFYGEMDGRPYKYEPEIWYCDTCHDDAMEDK